METGETDETLFYIQHFVKALGCGYSGEIPRKSKNCIIWLHFPILGIDFVRELFIHSSQLIGVRSIQKSQELQTLARAS